MKSAPKLIVIVGPTASGKSELAVRLAKKFKGEIISADSRQIYRHLTIGTGKIPGRWRKTKDKELFVYKKIPHHCIDFVPPHKHYSVAEYQTCAREALKDIVSRGKIPILAGGTGFWIDAVAYNFKLPSVPPNKKLRQRLAKKGVNELFSILLKLNQQRAATIEQKNPRRLIRAIEIARALGRVPEVTKKSPYNALWLGLNPPHEIRSLRIGERLKAHLHAGLIKEVRRLHKNGIPWKRFYEWGLQYRFLADYLRGKLTKKEMLSALERAINDYARRQMVWWKKNSSIRWIGGYRDAEFLIKKFLTRSHHVSSDAAD